MKRAFSLLVASSVVASIAACGDSTSTPAPLQDASIAPDTSTTDAPLPDGGGDAAVPPAHVTIAGRFARSALPLRDGAWAILTERPRSIRDPAALDPDRALAWVGANGVIEGFAQPPAGRALLDAVVHPSGEVTVLHASSEGFFFGRYGIDRKPKSYFHLVDPAIVSDPPAIGPGESKSPIEEHAHDVGRIAADDEGVVLATRTGRHSVVAYRVAFANGAYAVASRTLVVPAHPIYPVGLTGGTYDTFGQLDAHYIVHVVRGASGTAWVATSHARAESGEMVRAHEEVFGESLVTDPDGLDLFVSRIAKDGTRLGTSVVSTPNDDQLFGLRAIGDSAYAVGRTEHWNAQGTGFDALVARIDASGVVNVRELDVDRGDIAFDVAGAPDAGIVVVGASGYSQNPHGASISEHSTAFARWIHVDGTITAIDVPNGPRHNEARFVLSLGGGSHASVTYRIGGMHDGPGTHSADGDLSLLRADGFVMIGRGK